ncbi:sulfur-oxidizing protein SoxY [Poseidonocella pacifica]|uniref:Sulfur-oxidizing protein SoxY n=1 Tax=Poseidonocella pacifica TaxID=871651 RepID=A0A1I0YGH2_9RHOB|nr:quinoprotein dehydrogenase-associated SoxYZ-like carrier [Poseidonocella pacifica]SFB12459.1 sulfur-oxidizing protein SoxY [Poseidonocella pacifica]
MMRLASIAVCLAGALPAHAAEAIWPDLARDVFGDRTLLDGADLIRIDTPYRTDDDARTKVAAHVVAPAGHLIGSVSVILDENPMPVSAVFDFNEPVPRFVFDVALRFNGATPLHVVAEMTDGTLYMAEAYVKTSGKGACSAPPGTDPEVALMTLGEMDLALLPAEGGALRDRLAGLAMPQKRLDVDISHPSHSGMQMDQISLLFIPMRYVETVDIDIDGGAYVGMTGSISLSENPQLSLSVPGDARSAAVTMTDTDGTVSHAETTLPGY